MKTRKNLNRQWYNSNDVRPKTFHLEVERTPNGGYRILGAEIVNVINQHEQICQRIDVRDLASDVKRKGGIYAL